MTAPSATVRFDLPPERVATAPPEARGLRRDQVRLMVGRPSGIDHGVFSDLPDHIDAGDLVVVNTSWTMPAAVDCTHRASAVVVHVSGPGREGGWIVEMRRPDQSGPVLDADPGDVIALPHRKSLELITPDGSERRTDGTRLWRCRFGGDLVAHLWHHGRPIRYPYVTDTWSLGMYQTMFATGRPAVFGGAEMPSAGRPFTGDVVASLRRRGVRMASISLHTGVSSLEADEPPRPERYSVPRATSDAVNDAKARGHRVIAVGTTVTRALETVAAPDGTVAPGAGWTGLVLDADRPARVVDGLITGWHPPGASHIHLLEAVAGPDLIADAYRAALDSGYLWHEFGDSCLLLPAPPCDPPRLA